MKKIYSWMISVFMLISPFCVSAKRASEKELMQYMNDHAEIMRMIMFEYAGDEIDLQSAIDRSYEALFEQLDPYSQYYSPKEFIEMKNVFRSVHQGIGIQIDLLGSQFVIGKIIPNSPAFQAGLQKGDIIMKVNGKSTETFHYFQLIDFMQSQKQALTLDIKRNEKLMSFRCEKKELYSNPLEFTTVKERFPNDVHLHQTPVLLVNFSEFTEGSAKEFEKMLSYAKNNNIQQFIIDLRSNPGGDLEEVLHILSQITSQKSLIQLYDSKGKLLEQFTSKKKEIPQFYFVCLTSKRTASAAELFSCAVKENKLGISMGTTTYGKGSVQTMINLQSGGGFSLTVHEFRSGMGTIIKKKGVTPDIAFSAPEFLRLENLHQYKNESVKAVLDIISELGYTLHSPTSMTEENKKVLKEIQAKYRLNPTGEVDVETLLLLNLLYQQQIDLNDKLMKKAIEHCRMRGTK